MQTWTIEGEDGRSSKGIVRYIEAETKREASEIAHREGIKVSKISGGAIAIAVKEPKPDGSSSNLRTGSAAENRPVASPEQEMLAHVRVIRGWVTFIGVLILIGLILWIINLILSLIGAAASHVRD